MIESFLDVWRRFSGGSEDRQLNSQESSLPKNSEESFLAALKVVRRIVLRRSVSLRPATDAADLEQGIVLRLLDWRAKHREKSEEMSEGDWESFAARAAYNEINRQFTEKPEVETIPLDEVHEAADQKLTEGYASAEVSSLAQKFWQEICSLSLRQRRALLFHSQELILHFLESGIADADLARVLEVSEEDWLRILDRLPLSDFEIAEIARGNSSGDVKLESSTKSIKKARYEARGRLQKLAKK